MLAAICGNPAQIMSSMNRPRLDAAARPPQTGIDGDGSVVRALAAHTAAAHEESPRAVTPLRSRCGGWRFPACIRRHRQTHQSLSSVSTLGCCAFLLFLNPVPAQAGGPSWAAHNREFSIEVGNSRQSYVEVDPFGLTNNGTLDTEHGTLRNVELGARWQAQSLPLLLQATASRSNGGTHYSGYLQSGSQLNPYSGTTGNVVLDLTVRAGLPIAHGERWQWVPFIEFQRHRWQRQLVQYTENFNHSAGLVGMQVQWRQRADSQGATGPWSFEIDGAAGRVFAAHMDAASFGFNQVLGKRGLWQIAAALGYDLTPQWRISVATSARRFGYGQAADQAGVVEPASHTVQSALTIGVGCRY